MSATWWCSRCDREVEPFEVTFDERHDRRRGGCGCQVDGGRARGLAALQACVAELEVQLDQTRRNMEAQAERHLEAVRVVGAGAERIEELEGALRGMLALVETLTRCRLGVGADMEEMPAVQTARKALEGAGR